MLMAHRCRTRIVMVVTKTHHSSGGKTCHFTLVLEPVFVYFPFRDVFVVSIVSCVLSQEGRSLPPANYIEKRTSVMGRTFVFGI